VETLERRLPGFDQHLRINITGCPNSCGQHWIADLGIEGKKVKLGGALVDAYYFCVGGAVGRHQAVARPIGLRLPATDVAPAIERLLRTFLADRLPAENFRQFAARHTDDELRALLAGELVDAVARDVARAIHASGGKVPGFGHPVHRPLDPRAERILELSDARGVSGPHVLLARCLRDAVAEAWGKPLTMNVSMPIAAVLLDLGFPSAAAKAVPILARTAGLLAHLAEEQQRPLGFLMAGRAEEAIEYERQPEDKLR